MTTSSEDVLLQVPQVRYKKGDGTLYVMDQRIAWMLENRETFSISHHYQDIKGSLRWKFNGKVVKFFIPQLRKSHPMASRRYSCRSFCITAFRQRSILWIAMARRRKPRIVTASKSCYKRCSRSSKEKSTKSWRRKTSFFRRTRRCCSFTRISWWRRSWRRRSSGRSTPRSIPKHRRRKRRKSVRDLPYVLCQWWIPNAFRRIRGVSRRYQTANGRM